MAIGTHDLDTLEGPFTYEASFLGDIFKAGIRTPADCNRAEWLKLCFYWHKPLNALILECVRLTLRNLGGSIDATFGYLTIVHDNSDVVSSCRLYLQLKSSLFLSSRYILSFMCFNEYVSLILSFPHPGQAYTYGVLCLRVYFLAEHHRLVFGYHISVLSDKCLNLLHLLLCVADKGVQW